MSSEQELKCIFCSDTFSQKEDLQTHFRKHGDPNFKSKGRCQDEGDMSGEKTKDQNEVVECDVCSEVFSTISKAITHKHKIHPDHDTKYFCPWCGKLFTMKHLYNKHLQATHSEMEKSNKRLFHCDSCDVDFNVPTAIFYHNKFYHRQDELPLLGHSKKLKMIFEEVVQIYYCPFCGEEYDNKVNLHKHITDDHTCENQSPEDVFRCPLCDAIFYYLDAYELHLTYHSIEDLYTERSEMMDELIEFSLETVQPIQEKVECAEPLNENEPGPIGIEELLEFTMDDVSDNRKSKKHKKHKKSKKAPITLDEFLNMNNVFGEGIDFQGIEEVPTQVVAKRLKTKKATPSSKLISSDLAKLKRQGIVVKKQSAKTVKPTVMNKGASKALIKAQKIIKPMPQTAKALISTDDVLSKLLNQGSQIKIVKKTNQENEEHIQQKEDDLAEDRSFTTTVARDDEDKDFLPEVTEAEEQNPETCEKVADMISPTINSLKQASIAGSPNPESPSIIGDNADLKDLQNSNENSNNSDKSDDLDNHPHQAENLMNLAENINVLRNNSNMAIKLSKQNVPANMGGNTENQDDNENVVQIKKNDSHENVESNANISEKSSINALKHLSHLITIKPVNTTQTPLLCEKPENGLQKETAAQMPQNNSPKTCEAVNLTNFKNLGSITIKPTTQSSLNVSISPQLAETKNSIDEETDDEENEDQNKGSQMNADKLAHMLKSPQLSIQTKHSPKNIQIQKESPKGTVPYFNENSQSSADLLKHLKNVTAKPVTVNPPKIPTPISSPSSTKRSITSKVAVQKEVTEDGIEIFSIDDSDSDDANCSKTSNATIKTTENKMETNKSIDAFKNFNKNITFKSTNQQSKPIDKEAEGYPNKAYDDEDDDWDDDFDDKEEAHTNSLNTKFSSPKPNQKNVAINNVLKNLSRNITVKSRNSSPNRSAQSHDQNSKDSRVETNEADSDSDSPLSRVKITEMENMSDDEFVEEHAENDIPHGNVKIEHPDDSHSDHDDGPMDEEFDDMSDIESQIVASKVVKDNSEPNSSINNLKNLNKNLTITSNKATVNTQPENSEPPEEIPKFAKNLSSQISIKQIKKPETNKNTKVVDQTARRSTNPSSMNQKMASTSNQVNTFNKEVKTVKTFQTQTNTVVQEITTTVTKTIKTVNQTTKQEIRNMCQSSSSPMIAQKVQGLNTIFSQKNFQGVKVRQSAPSVRPKVRGQAPQTMRPAICAPPVGTRPAICSPSLTTRPAICAPVRAFNQLVPVRPTLNRPSGPRPRMPNVNIRASTSGQQRPQIGRPVKVSPGAVFTSNKRPAEAAGHFSCFKKPKESLIPVPDFSTNEGESSVQFSSAVQMSKSNFSSTTKIQKGNSVVTSTQMKSEMSTNSQHLSKLRGMSGLSVVKTSQNQAKQTQVEEKSEMSASKRNALEAIQKLQNQGLLVKKPRLNEDDHSQPGSDDNMEHDSNDEFDE